MFKKITLVPLTLFITLIVCLKVSATDMTVFGLKLGEKFDLAECEKRTKPKYDKIESYKFNDKGICFQRRDAKFFSSDKKPSTTPIINETVWISFPLKEQPDIAIDIRGIVIDGNLESIFFYTGGYEDGDYVLNTLTQKYGKPANLISRKVQNGFGATFDAYTANWTFDNLFVVFNSVTDTIKYGRVDINTKKAKEAEEKKIEDLNKTKRVL